jgi:hypothetical protein
MKNVAITLDEEVARWARIMAAKKDTRVSRLAGEMRREKMIEEQHYQLERRTRVCLRTMPLICLNFQKIAHFRLGN